jgi:O-antigen/teichoic acid export membrane protein
MTPTIPAQRTGEPMGGRTRALVGLLDQAVIALANAGNTVLALALLDRTRAGVMLLSLGLGYLVIGVNRAFVGEVLLTLASRFDDARRDRLVRDGAATALAVGVAAAALCVPVGLLVRHGQVDLRDLVWLAPFLPALLLHDTARYTYLSARQPQRALLIDAVWVGTQLAGVLLLAAAGRAGAGGLFTCWGLGATAGAATFLARSRVRPWRGSPRSWFDRTRRLSGWFTATALIGQLQGQAVGFLVTHQLSARELSGLRGAQTALLQPVQNFITAVMGLLVPRASRLAARAGEGEPDAARALRRQTRTLALAFAALGALLVAVVVPVAGTVLVRVPKFADIAPLALPIAVQPALYLVQLPFAAALRGLHRARLLFVQYTVFTSASLTGLVLGAAADRLPGAAWGLTAGSATGLATMIALYAKASRTPDSGSVTGAAAVDPAGHRAAAVVTASAPVGRSLRPPAGRTGRGSGASR